MDLRDLDLISIQEARNLVAQAAAAQKIFAAFSQAQIDAIVESCAAAACAAAAVDPWRAAPRGRDWLRQCPRQDDEEPAGVRGRAAGHGRHAHDRRDRRGSPTEERGIVEVASPVGVVAAVIPSTNPTSTAIYNTLIALKSGNAIVLSPHPSARESDPDLRDGRSTLSRAAPLRRVPRTA